MLISSKGLMNMSDNSTNEGRPGRFFGQVPVCLSDWTGIERGFWRSITPSPHGDAAVGGLVHPPTAWRIVAMTQRACHVRRTVNLLSKPPGQHNPPPT
jgi:hypothetical protein